MHNVYAQNHQTPPPPWTEWIRNRQNRIHRVRTKEEKEAGEAHKPHTARLQGTNSPRPSPPYDGAPRCATGHLESESGQHRRVPPARGDCGHERSAGQDRHTRERDIGKWGREGSQHSFISHWRNSRGRRKGDLHYDTQNLRKPPGRAGVANHDGGALATGFRPHQQTTGIAYTFSPLCSA